MALEVFANDPVTTVVSGGTTSPDSGNSETWTVSSSAAFPAASSSASPPTQFRGYDPDLPSELMIVTNVSGTTWTVTRGAEGTLPVSHAANFTFTQDITAGVLGSFLQSGQELSGDVTGTYPDLTVSKIQGVATPSSAPAAGQVLTATSPTASAWQASSSVQIDGTATDIKPLGTQAAGTVGKAADAGHVHPTTGVLISANNLSDLASVTTAMRNLGFTGVVNVRNYGATGNGTTDDTAAIQDAINAAGTTACVYLPAGTYKTSAALTLSSDYMQLFGDGIDLTVIEPEAGATFNVIETPIAPASTGSGYQITGVTVRDLTINCANMTGTTAGQGNGIFWFGAIQCNTERVRITGCPNWAIVFDATPDNDAYDCIVSECRIEDCAGEIGLSYNTAARVYNSYLSGPTSNTLAANQPVYTNVSNSSYAIAGDSANCLIEGNVFGQGSASVTNPAINLTNSGPSRIIGNFFINTSGAAITSQAGGHNQIIVGNEFSGCCVGTSYSGPCLYIGADGTVITGNVFDVSNGDFTNMTYALQVNGSAGSCSVTGNTFLAGSDGVIDEGTDWYIAGNIEGSTTSASSGTGPDFTGPVAALVTGSGGASSTAEFQIGSLTIPAGQPKSTTLYQFIVHGGIATGTASQTVEFRARIGSITGTVMFDSGALTPEVTSGSDWFINANIGFRGTGSTELDCWGTFLESFTTGVAVSHPVIETYKSVTTTSAIEIVLTAVFTASNASNSASTTQGAIIGVSR